MTLHEDPTLFRQAIQATAQWMTEQGKPIPEIFIEKDYWVTLALHRIFHGPAKDYAIFKGGTSLSKCHRLIERFSEDIDMAVVRTSQDAPNQMKEKLRAISKSVEIDLPEVEVPGKTNKKGMIRKTVHHFPKARLQGIYGQVGEEITLESSWLGTFEPHVTAEVSCYIHDMMRARGQSGLIAQFGMQPFSVKVLSKERTFCEKVMSLVRFSNTPTPYADLALKVRHIYDIHQMLKDNEVKAFVDSPEFSKLLNKVGQDDIESYKNNNAWLRQHPNQALLFLDPENTWEQIRGTYQTSFKDMVTGPLPPETDLIKTLEQIKIRLDSVDWTVIPK